jgi:hypothetical protein
MEFIKWFVYVTTGFMILGCLVLLNEGLFDFYVLWNVAGFIAASIYINNTEKK